MPDPDGRITSRDLGDKAVISRALDENLTVGGTLQAERFHTEPYTPALDATHTFQAQLYASRLHLFTGDTEEKTAGNIVAQVSGSSPTAANRALYTVVRAPALSTDPNLTSDATELVLFSEAADDTVAPTIETRYAGSSALQPRVIFNSNWRVFVNGDLKIPTGTSDPASPVNGLIYVNTSSNKLRFYSSGAWRQVTST